MFSFEALLGGGFIFILSIVALLVLGRRVKKKLPALPGPANREFGKLFEEQRERAFTTLTQTFGKTFVQDGYVNTADPILAKQLFNSRAHSVARAWPYRLMTFFFPDSDGILFLGDDAWRRRHSAFTPLFTGSNVARYSQAMLRAALMVAHSNAIDCVVQPDNPTRVPSLSAKKIIGEAKTFDLLAAVRCISERVLLEWGLGMPADDPVSVAVGDVVDRYARTTLEVIPGNTKSLLWNLRTYGNLYTLRTELRRLLADAIARGLYTGDFTNAAFARRAHDTATTGTSASAVSPQEPPQWAPADSVSTEHRCPPNFVTRMLANGFTPAELSSEVNHVHGAHKAAAFTATCALIELGMPGRSAVRQALIAEFESVCGRPDTGALRAAVSAVAAAPPGRAREAAVAAANGALETALNSAGVPGTWRLPSRSDLEAGRLPLLSRIWRETLRRHVVSLGVTRRIGGEEPFTVAPGVELPPGTDIVVLLHAMHHAPDVWGPDADVWDPDRWLRLGSGERSGVSHWGATAAASGHPSGSGGGTPSPLESFFPFLDGLRRCAGLHLAELQFAVILYALTVVCELELLVPPLPPPAPPPARATASGRAPCLVHPIPEGDFASEDSTLGAYALVPRPSAAGGMGQLDPRQPYEIRKRANMFSSIDGRVPFRVAYRK